MGNAVQIEEIRRKAQELAPAIIAIRRKLHREPELSEREKETAGLVAATLRERGIACRTGIAGNGAVCRIGKGSRGFVIRADMDALPVTEETGLAFASVKPGVMHACGHDLHTASLLGTALLLKEYENVLTRAGFTLICVFQPAEETIGGAKPMIRAGILKHPPAEAAIAFHADPNYPAGTVVLRYGAMNAETCGFRLTVQGKSAHGAHPEKGMDAIVVAGQMIMALQAIPSRMTAPETPVIVHIGKLRAGEASNVLAREAVLSGTLRALSHEVMLDVKKYFRRVVSNTAAAYGAQVQVELARDGYPALINDDRMTDLIEQNALRLFGKDRVTRMPEASLGGDDFAFFAEKVPSCYFNIGTAIPGVPYAPLHSPHFNPSEEAIPTAIAIESAAALDYMGLLEKEAGNERLK